MLFRFTDEQLMIQSMVREFSRKVIATTAAERDRTKEFPAANLKKMAELGLLGMMVPRSTAARAPTPSVMSWHCLRSPIPVHPRRWSCPFTTRSSVKVFCATGPKTKRHTICQNWRPVKCWAPSA